MVGYNDILSIITQRIEKKKKLSFTYVNAYVALTAHQDEMLKSNLLSFTSLYADGTGIYLASKILFGPYGLKDRINATDLHFKILELAEHRKYRTYFLGGGDRASQSLKKKIGILYPNLLISGMKVGDKILNESTINEINKSNSDIVFVALGTPLQEKWITTFCDSLDATVLIGVGSWFEFVAGVYPRAPLFLRKHGFEWLYRLLQEPKRLAKRYIIGIPKFVFIIFKQFLKEKLNWNGK